MTHFSLDQSGPAASMAKNNPKHNQHTGFKLNKFIVVGMSWPFKLLFYMTCSVGTSMKGIVITHHMGMTLLSCCWVTGRFRLPIDMCCQLLFYIRHLFSLVLSCYMSVQTHKYTKSGLSLEGEYQYLCTD